MPDLSFEQKFGHPSKIICGVDEVGRGCLAGPVVAAAVILPKNFESLIEESNPAFIKKISDSKKLTEKTREELDPLIREWVPAFGIGEASVEEIDEINIFHAAHLAMKRAIEKVHLKIPIDHLLIDGKFLPKNLPTSSSAIIKGDNRSLSIACASIIAKVYRDHLMVALEDQYPGYGLSSHKGYSTKRHKEALLKLGVTEIHRRSFAPVRDTLQGALSI